MSGERTGEIAGRRPALVLGAGGHARTVIAALRDAGRPVAGVLDAAQGPGETVLGAPVLAPMPAYVRYLRTHDIYLALGANQRRRRLFLAIRQKGGHLPSLVHPAASVHPGVPVGEGAFVAGHAVVCPGATLGEGCIVNTRALVEHDGRIGPFAHVAPDASLAGRVQLGEGAFVGLRAVVRDGMAIGAWAVAGAGAVVVAPVPARAVVAGNPARILSFTVPGAEVDARDMLVGPGAPLAQAMERIDYCGTGAALVVEDGRLQGIVTDGIIRRAQLAGAGLDTPVAEVMSREFVSVRAGQEAGAAGLFSHLIKFLPVLDGEGRLVEVLWPSTEAAHAPAAPDERDARRLKLLHQVLRGRQTGFAGPELERFQAQARGLLGGAPLFCGSGTAAAAWLLGVHAGPWHLSPAAGPLWGPAAARAGHAITVGPAEAAAAVLAAGDPLLASPPASWQVLVVACRSMDRPTHPAALPFALFHGLGRGDEVDAAEACALDLSADWPRPPGPGPAGLHQFQAAYGLPDLEVAIAKRRA